MSQNIFVVGIRNIRLDSIDERYRKQLGNLIKWLVQNDMVVFDNDDLFELIRRGEIYSLDSKLGDAIDVKFIDANNAPTLMVMYPYYRNPSIARGSISEREVEEIYSQIVYYASYAYEGLVRGVGAEEAKKLMHDVVASMLFRRLREVGDYGEPRAWLYVQWFKHYGVGYDNVVGTPDGKMTYVVGDKVIDTFTYYDYDEYRYVTMYDFAKNVQKTSTRLKV